MSLQGAGAALFALIPGRTALDWSQICMHGPPRCKAQNFDSICTFSTSIFVILAKPTTNAISFVSTLQQQSCQIQPPSMRWEDHLSLGQRLSVVGGSLGVHSKLTNARILKSVGELLGTFCRAPQQYTHCDQRRPIREPTSMVPASSCTSHGQQ
jgi:hypothetical protein